VIYYQFLLIPSRYHTVGAAGAPLSTLINGKGRYVGGDNVDLAVVNVKAGKKYRLRIVSISCDPNFKFSIDGEDFPERS
jgi:iron transport multicopper oxidase